MVRGDGLGRLLAPVPLGPVTLPGKLMLAPINTGLFREGHLTPAFFSFHTERAGNGIGVCCVGNVAVSPELVTNEGTAYFSEENLEEWRALTAQITARGSVPAVQLGCRCSSIPPMRDWVNPCPEEYIEAAAEEISGFSPDRLRRIGDLFAEAAGQAWACGFRMIQIHAAHGYLLSLLTSETFNRRQDEYRCRDFKLLKDIVYAVRGKTPGAAVEVRISLLEGLRRAGEELEEKAALLRCLTELPVDLVGVSNGIYNLDKRLIYPPAEWGEEKYLRLGQYLADRFPGQRWSVVGNLRSLPLLRAGDRENLLFAFGRQLIRDPRFIRKYREGRAGEIGRCSGCGNCHYYSNEEPSMLPCAAKQALRA